MTTKRLARIVELHPVIDTAGNMSAPPYVLRNRRNKIAIGMTKTVYRSCQSISDSACTLSVKGTTDRLGASSWMYIRRDLDTGMFRLTEKGRNKLARLKLVWTVVK